MILGASGFVARDLSRHLADQQIVHRAIGSGEIDLMQPASVELLRQAVGEHDALVITSGLTPDKGRDVGTLMKNLAMAQHIAAFLESSRCAHVIYISSDSVYDGRETLLRESSTTQPTDLYSLMHLAREHIISFAAAKSKAPLCIFRPCAIYGADDTHNSYGPNRFFRTALKDRKITLFGGGEETRDHVYIGDVCRLLALCLTHRSTGVINAASGTAAGFLEVAARIAKLCGPDVQVECLPRSSPVTHRPFDVTERIRAFPSFVPLTLEHGLSAMFQALTGAAPS
ncbi:MAG TPA: NAD(P)-dependent oxidoreductase [Verrucomicrobiaceae bacterium]